MILRFFLSASVSLWLTGSWLGASSFVMMSDQGLADRAPHIASVRVLGILNPEGQSTHTQYEIQILEWLKGQGENTVRLQVPGVRRADGSGLLVFGAPAFRPGQEALLFLKRRKDGSYGIFQFMLGAFHRFDDRGRRLALRNFAGSREIAGRPSGKGRSAGFDQPRDWSRFVTWLRDREHGHPRSADYWVETPPAQFRRLQERFVLLTSPSDTPIRWFRFDQAAGVTFQPLAGGQEGWTGGGIDQLDVALNSWNDDPASGIDYRLGPDTEAQAGLLFADGINSVLFNDPNDEIAGSFVCGAGGALAIGGPFFTQVQSFQGTPYHRAVSADIVIQDGAGCFLAENDGSNGEEVFAHEFGHTLGLAHSSVDQSIMRSSVYRDGRGAFLAPDDLAAVNLLYPNSNPTVRPDLKLGLTSSRDPVQLGDFLDYHLHLRNDGTALASQVTLTDTLPPEAQFVSSLPPCTLSGRQLQCALGTLAVDQNFELQITVRITSEPPDLLFNSARVASGTTEVITDNNFRSIFTLVLPPSLDLSLDFIQIPQPLTSGDTLEYGIRVRNQGEFTARRVEIVSSLSPLVDFDGPPQTFCRTEQDQTICFLGTLAPQATVDLTLRLIAERIGTLRHTARIRAREPDPVLGNNLKTVETPVVGRIIAPLSIDEIPAVGGTGFVGIALYNPLVSGNRIRVSGLDEDGAVLGESLLAPLQQQGQTAFLAADLVPQIGVRLVSAVGQDGPLQGFFLLGDLALTRQDGIGGALDEATEQYFVLDGAESGADDLLFLQNPGPAHATVDMRVFSAEGSAREQTSLELAVGGSLWGELSDFFAGQIESGPGYLRVDSDVPVRGFSLIAGTDALSSSPSLGTTPLRRLFIPHYFADDRGGFSRLSLLNSDSSAAQVTVKAFDDSGQLSGTARRTLVPGHLLFERVDQALGLDVGPGQTVGGSLVIDVESVDGGGPVAVDGLITFGGPGFRAALPALDSGGEEFLFLHVAQSNALGVFTGLAIHNTSSETASVTVRVFDRKGALTAERVLTLAANRRVIDLLNGSSFFGGAFQQIEGHIQVTADRDVAAFALFGDFRQRYLAAIQGQPPIR